MLMGREGVARFENSFRVWGLGGRESHDSRTALERWSSDVEAYEEETEDAACTAPSAPPASLAPSPAPPKTWCIKVWFVLVCVRMGLGLCSASLRLQGVLLS